ncbi:MAG TPA: adenylate/guanylate cyclase domain-containing protein [Candidatus Limnocylindrales bacterium]|nr:adenylate/guanylate cyclase domain-containing protein [Candidatus Limnocylindrales bacterium]
MADSPDGPPLDAGRLTADELARLVGDPVERVEDLTTRGVLIPDHEGRFVAGDAHRIRVIDGFEAAGVPLDALIRAQEAGVISVAYYDQLHGPPGRPSSRAYSAFKDVLGARAALLPAMFGAFGIAEPDPTSHLSNEDEAVMEDIATLVEATGQIDLALRVFRQFGEATRRASEASLEIYENVIERLEPEFAGVPSEDVYNRYFLPWARLARSLPAFAEWLASRHLSRAIDDYSIRSTEGVLEASGFVPQRPEVQPAVAFLDLTGFTRLTQKHGDAAAAEVALRLAEVAARTAEAHGGRVVKLLGDGVLMRFANVIDAVDASFHVLGSLAASGLPPGHVGVTAGPIITRDGDIFGRTVNLAARISDVAPSGEVYVPASTAAALASRFRVEPVGARTLAGIGAVELARVATAAPGTA